MNKWITLIAGVLFFSSSSASWKVTQRTDAITGEVKKTATVQSGREKSKPLASSVTTWI